MDKELEKKEVDGYKELGKSFIDLGNVLLKEDFTVDELRRAASNCNMSVNLVLSFAKK